jgi:uncharacterized membrane protein
MNFIEYITSWINENSGKATGAFIGFLIGIFILTLGVPKTLLILLFMLLGFLIGKTKDDNISIIDQLTGLFKRKKKNYDDASIDDDYE